MISQELIDHLPEIFFTTDAERRITSISASAATLLGYHRRQLLERPLSSLCCDETQFEGLCGEAEAAPGRVISQSLSLRTLERGLIWVELRLCARLAEDGTFSGLEGIARDITEQRALLLQVSESEDRFRRLSDLSCEAVIIHHEGRILDCNQATENMFGYSHAELTRMDGLNLIARSDRELVKQRIARKSQLPYLSRGRRADGSKFPIEIHARQSLMGEQEVRVTCIQDLSTQHQIRDKAQMLSEALENCPVAVVITDPEGEIEYVNAAAVEMTGFAPEALCQSQLIEMFCQQLEPEVKWLSWKLTLGQDWQGQLRMKRLDGEELRVQARLTATRDRNGDIQHQSLVLEDITLRETQAETIRHQASFDALTGLPNRTQAAEQMEQMLADARDNESQVAMLFVDLDEFKSINDTLGHSAGDELLQRVAQRLQRAIKREHCLARFGGDEFLVMVSGIRASTEVEALTERVLSEISEPFEIEGRQLSVTTSVGVALYPLDGQSFTALLRNADTAMSQAKARGKNGCCFFNSQMNQQVERRLQIESHLRWALERNELSLNYQPVIDFASGQSKGAEALLRWHSAELGFVPPDQFIPVAENNGMIVPIGRWVLNEACRQAKQWQQHYGLPLRVAVNVSPRQFHGENLVGTVSQALADSNLSPQSLEIEVTEGLLMSDHADIRRVFRELRAMGVRIAIDDFGTGYSSLAYLEKFTFDTLKIDKAFVGGMAPGTRRDTLVNSMITMAQGLDLKVVAEGVETSQQVERLSELGCDFAQGYFYSRPLPAPEFADWLRQNSAERVSAEAV